MKTFKVEKSLKSIGIAQIIIGILTVSCGVVVLTLLNQDFFLNNNAVPIWSGVSVICTGVVGVCYAAFSDKKWLIKFYIGHNVISVVLMLLAFCASLAGIVFYEACPADMRKQHQNYYSYGPAPTYPTCYRPAVGRGMFSSTLALAVVGSIVTFAGLIKSCMLVKGWKNKKDDSELSLLIKDDDQHENQVVTFIDGKKYVLMPHSVEDEEKESDEMKTPPVYHLNMSTEK